MFGDVSRNRRYRYFATACLAAILLIAALALLAALADIPLLLSYGRNYYPIASASAAILAVLSSAQLGLMWLRPGRAQRWLLWLPLPFAAVGLYLFVDKVLGRTPELERFFIQRQQGLNGYGPVYASAIAVGAMVLISAALLMIYLPAAPHRRRTGLASVLAAAVAAVGLVTALGYLYGTPFLYGQGEVRPIALPASISLVLFGAALLAAAGPESLMLRLFTGSSIRARLMRIFVPLVAALLIIDQMFLNVFHQEMGMNPALLAALSLFIFIPLVMILLIELVRGVGGSIDGLIARRRRAEAALRRSRFRFRSLFEAMSQGVIIINNSGRVTDVNRSAAEILGVPAEQLKREAALDSFLSAAGEDGSPLPAGELPHSACLRTGKKVTDQICRVFNPSTNEYRWIKMAAVSRSLPAGDGAVEVFLTLDDVTGRWLAREELARSEEKFRTLVESAASPILILSTEGDIMELNREAEQLYGSSRGELLGQNLFHLFLPREAWPAALAMFQRVIREGETVKHHTKAMPAAGGGSHRTIQWASSRLQDREGRPWGAVLVGQDVTRRVQAEAALKKERDRARSYLEAAGAIMLVLDADRTVRLINRRGCEILGVPEEEVQGSDWFERFVPANQREGEKERFRRLIAGSISESEYWESPVLSTLDTERMIGWRQVVLTGADGGVTGVLSSGEDVTDRRRAEAALRRSESQLAEAQRLARIGSWERDQQDSAVRWSDETFRIYGLPKQASAPKTAELLALVHPRDRERMRVNLQQAFAGDPRPIDFRITEPGGRERCLHGEVKAIKDDQGRPTRLLGTVQDVTERVEAEALLRASELKFRSLVQQSADGVVLLDEEGRVVEWNGAQERITGIERGRAQGEHLWDLLLKILPEDQQAPAALDIMKGDILGWLDPKRPAWLNSPIEKRIQRCDGSEVYIQTVTFPIRTTGKPLAAAVTRDVSERVWQMDKIREQSRELGRRNNELTALYRVSSVVASEMDLSRLLQRSLEAVLELSIHDQDLRGGILVVENGGLRLAAVSGPMPPGFAAAHAGMREGECLCGQAAMSGEIVVSPDCDADRQHTIRLPGTKPHGHVIVPLKSSDRVMGVMFLYVQRGRKVPGQAIRLLETIGIQLGTAIANVKLFEETRKLSLHDSLTGLANRNLMNLELRKNLALARRSGTEFAVAMLDLDHFKRYNDRYGHTMGDRLLAGVAGLVMEEVREMDLPVRYGGEEFLIIFPETDLQGAVDVAERVRSRVEQAVFYHGDHQPSGITLSAGVAVYDPGVEDEDEIVRRADDALYRAKRAGRNRVLGWRKPADAA